MSTRTALPRDAIEERVYAHARRRGETYRRNHQPGDEVALERAIAGALDRDSGTSRARSRYP